jgi:hypothetical protein
LDIEKGIDAIGVICGTLSMRTKKDLRFQI